MSISILKQRLPLKLYENLKTRIKKLMPVQEKAVKAGLLEGKSIVVCSPTASGKTLIAEIAMLKHILEHGGKAIYTAPLKALATEKFNDFKNCYEKLGIKVALSIGDLDSSDPYLANYDIIICSNEKLDSLIRHNAGWLRDVGVVVIDEIHLLNDIERGPTLEVLITMLKELLQAQFIALSATVGNPEEIADWLNAELVKDIWRPVKLYEGVGLHHIIDFFGEKKKYKIKSFSKDITIDLALDTLLKNKQVLIFVNSKRSAEALAENISKSIIKFSETIVDINKNIMEESLKEYSSKILKALSNPTKQCERLAFCIKSGVAFHHSGLAPLQRSLIENAFKEGKIKIICCTPTLALGLEFPSDRVVIRDLRRFSGYSSVWLPVLEIKQFVGRAGRPSYHTEGEAICVAKTENEKEEIYERYICGSPEEIYSKLALEPVLRMYILSLIAISFTRTKEKLIDFFEKTFWAFQYGDITRIESKLDRILNMLKKFKFILEEDGKLKATPLGLRVAQLYIDPISAFHLIKAINTAFNEKRFGGKLREIGVLHSICQTTEMKPLLRVKQSEYEEIQEELNRYEEDLYEQPDFIDESFLDAFKTSLMLYDWISERGEEYLLERYRIRPGELLSKLQNCDWMLYSFEQLALILGKKDIVTDIAKLRIRIKYGIKEELLPLVRIKDVGKVRARLLFNAGIKTARDIRKAEEEKLAFILKSKALAKKLKEQVMVKK